MRRTLMLLLPFTLFTACHYTEKVRPVWKVEVATSRCNGTCQSTLTVIDSNLNYHFYGGGVAKGGAYGRRGKIFGFYTAKVSRRFWDSLATRLEASSWQSLDTGYKQENDVQFIEILLHYGHRVKLIHGYEIDMPDGIRKTIQWVAGSYATIRPAASKDTFKSDLLDWDGWRR